MLFSMDDCSAAQSQLGNSFNVQQITLVLREAFEQFSSSRATSLSSNTTPSSSYVTNSTTIKSLNISNWSFLNMASILHVFCSQELYVKNSYLVKDEIVAALYDIYQT